MFRECLSILRESPLLCWSASSFLIVVFNLRAFGLNQAFCLFFSKSCFKTFLLRGATVQSVSNSVHGVSMLLFTSWSNREESRLEFSRVFKSLFKALFEGFTLTHFILYF